MFALLSSVRSDRFPAERENKDEDRGERHVMDGHEAVRIAANAKCPLGEHSDLWFLLHPESFVGDQ